MVLNLDHLLLHKARNGIGVFTDSDLTRNEPICKVRGKFETPEEIEADGVFSKESADAYRFSKYWYLSPKGNIAEFFNHSCEPNAYIKKVDKDLYVCASQFIPSGSEILLDYSTIMAKDDAWTMQCNCGSTQCRKIIKRFIDLPLSLQETYKEKGWVPDYILEI